jgi:hypothetical protein
MLSEVILSINIMLSGVILNAAILGVIAEGRYAKCRCAQLQGTTK